MGLGQAGHPGIAGHGASFAPAAHQNKPLLCGYHRLCDAAKRSRLCDAQSLQSCVIDAPFIAGVLGSLPSESVIFARLSCDVMSTGSRRIVLGTTGARGKAAGRPPMSMHGAIAARRASSMRSVGHAGGVRPASSGRSG